MTYERPTLAKAGGFRRTTGLAGQTAKDLLGGHQLV
ncbi:keywimysin-related RiPP [Streptomyces capparidis]